MAAVIRGTRRIWNGTRDAEGHREYKIKHLIETDPNDGPYTVLRTPGLPIPGSLWQFGNDNDPWAWCHPDATVTALQAKDEYTKFWEVEQTFSTKPP